MTCPNRTGRWDTSGRAEEVSLDHEVEAERLVADLVEEDDDLVAVVPHNGSLGPLVMCNPRLDLERAGGRVGRLRLHAGVADIAVAARPLERLAEVVEDEPAAARPALGVRTHHLDARPVEFPPALGRLDRLVDGTIDRHVV